MTAYRPIGNTAAINIGTSNARVALPATVPDRRLVRVYSTATVVCYIAFGDFSVVAAIPTSGGTANGIPVPPGREQFFEVDGGDTHVAVISGTAAGALFATVVENSNPST